MSILKKHCQVCSSKKNDLIGILQKDDDNVSHLTKLITIMPQMRRVKSPSRLMCKGCINELNVTYKFFKKCIKNKKFSVALNDDSITINDRDDNDDLCLIKPGVYGNNVLKIEEDLPLDSIIERRETISTQTSELESTQLSNIEGESCISDTVSDTIKCLLCTEEFKNKEDLEEHVKVSHAVQKLLEFDNYVTVRRAVGKDTRKFIAEIKKRSQKREILFDTSLNLINTYNATKTSTEINLEDTQSEGTRKSRKRYECVYCAKLLNTKVQLTKHVQLHEISLQDKKCFKCKQCKASFKELTRLALHVRAVHEKLANHECAKCKVVCSSLKSLRAHMHVHDKNKKGPGYVSCKGGFKCLKCGAVLSGRSSITSHMPIHSSARPFTCTKCPAAFKTSSCLGQHVATQHEPPRYPCSACSRVFNYKYTLLQHLVTHVENKQEHNM